MTGHDLSAALQALWTQFGPLVRERLAVLEECVEALATQRATPGLVARALTCAHALSGSLGSYGRPEGSRLAAAIEAQLGAPSPDLDVLRRDVAALRQVVTRP